MGLSASFNREYDIEFEAFGEGIINEENFEGCLDRFYEEYRQQFSGEPRDVSFNIRDTFLIGLGYGYTGIDTAYLERMEKLKELILPNSITEIEMSEKLGRILSENNTLIRGSFDSFAERFASENGLNFRPSDLVFASREFAPAHETTTYTLIFRRDGSVSIEQNVSSPGSSAGNCFGGTFYKDLPYDFWMTMTAEDVASVCGGECVIKAGRMAAFIEKAKQHKIYTGKN